MSGSNRELGTNFERDLAETLHDMGFWVHLMKQNAAGQPADIIAVKKNRAVLIDAKVCSDYVFRTSRIEANQLGSMSAWEDAGNREWWFALLFPTHDVYMIPGATAARWEMLYSTSSNIYWRDVEGKFMTLKEWGERFDNKCRQ